MNRLNYNKPYISVNERINHLKQKGLIINDENFAHKKINTIGYERLRIYFTYKRNSDGEKLFLDEVKFEDIIDIYNTDKKIRNLSIDSVGTFEIIFRNYLSETLGEEFGSHPFYKEIFKGRREELDAHKNLLRIFSGSLKDKRLSHYMNKYSTPLLPPIWIIKDVMTFGGNIHFFKNLKKEIRIKIANKFNVDSDNKFVAWLQCLNDFRNASAHHERLFNRSFQKQPPTYEDPNYKDGIIPLNPSYNNKISAILDCIDFLLNNSGEYCNYSNDAREIINECDSINLIDTGYEP